MMDGLNDGMGSGWWVLMPVLWVALIGLVVWAIVRLFPSRYEREGGGAGAREILDRRLAQGEIDARAYEELRGRIDNAARAGR